MNPAVRLAVLAAASLAALCLMLPAAPTRSPHSDMADGRTELVIYCAAGLRLPMEQIAAAYQRECGVATSIHYGGSNTLLSQIEVSRVGDLFLAADDYFLRVGQEKGLVEQVTPLGKMRPIVGVARGNPLGIASLDDLLARRVATGNPEQTAIGQNLRQQLKAIGRWEPLERRIRDSGVFKPTVNDVANDILLGSVDAGVIWDAVASQYPGIDAVEIPELQSEEAELGVGLLKSTQNQEAAIRFVRFLAAKDRGLLVLEETGYDPIVGEPWTPTQQEGHSVPKPTQAPPIAEQL